MVNDTLEAVQGTTAHKTGRKPQAETSYPKISYNERQARMACKELLQKHYHGHRDDKKNIESLIMKKPLMISMNIESVSMSMHKKGKKLKIEFWVNNRTETITFEPTCNGESVFYF